MTGYFSRLAERTGLGLATHAARRASGGGDAPAPSSDLARERAAPAPLHTEEITFVAQPEGDAREAFSQSAGESFRDAASERAGEGAHRRRDEARTGDFTTGAAAHAHAAGTPGDHETETPHTRRTNSDRPLESFPEAGGKHIETSAPQRRRARERGVENYEAADGAREPHRHPQAAEKSLPSGTDQARLPEPQRGEATREAPEGFASPLEREAIGGMSRAEVYQTYLREVRKWVAEDAPATLDEVVSRERSRVAAAEEAFATAREREPVTQDFNLSIGTISIVVEEPAAQTIVQATPPARAERAPAPRGAAHSSGRNYLRFK